MLWYVFPFFHTSDFPGVYSQNPSARLFLSLPHFPLALFSTFTHLYSMYFPFPSLPFYSPTLNNPCFRALCILSPLPNPYPPPQHKGKHHKKLAQTQQSPGPKQPSPFFFAFSSLIPALRFCYKTINYLISNTCGGGKSGQTWLCGSYLGWDVESLGSGCLDMFWTCGFSCWQSLAVVVLGDGMEVR